MLGFPCDVIVGVFLQVLNKISLTNFGKAELSSAKSFILQFKDLGIQELENTLIP